MEQILPFLDDQKKALFIWLTGLLIAIILLYIAYKIRNHSKVGLISLITIGIFLGIVMAFFIVITIMLGMNG